MRLCLRERADDPALLQKHGLKATGDKIESFGKSAHGSMPELGKNAILPLLRYMADCGENVGALIDIFEDKAGITAQGNETGMRQSAPTSFRRPTAKSCLPPTSACPRA